MRIIFMGTPEFAVPSLDILIKNGYNVVAVVTAPDKPAGRGLQMAHSAVKEYAVKNGLKVLQPEKLKDEQFIEELKGLKADVQVVVAFRMLPEVIWNMPPKGTFNLHASLLPQYRGAAPLNWAIINGETETGVTTFFLQHEIDTGDIILQDKEPILDSDNVGTLYERMKLKGAELVLKTIQTIEIGNVKTQKQLYVQEVKLAPKIFKEHGKINWHKKASEIHNLVRGLSPYPAAYFSLNGKTCKIFSSKITSIPVKKEEKALFQTDQKTYLHIACSDFYLSILELQLEGKKKMAIEEFLRGTQVLEVN
jgi:methionyl-tRNA formyltransferase